MNNTIKKIISFLKISFVSIFYGLKGGNELLSQTHDSESNILPIQQNLRKGGVMNDLLENKITDEVVELRDKNYRIYKEADKFDASTIQMSIDENGDVTFSTNGRLKKKNSSFFSKHVPVYNTEGYLIRTIQDNKIIERQNEIPLGIYDYDVTLSIKRKDFIPRFNIEKIVTKIVVREKEDGNRTIVDLYLPTIPSQFGKIDAIVISNISTMWKEGIKKSDLTDFDEIEWYSDKAWNSEDLCLFKYNKLRLDEINIFDGNFVLSFDCDIICDGESVVKKYETKKVDNEYKTNAPKTNTINIITAERKYSDKIDVNNIEKTIIKL